MKERKIDGRERGRRRKIGGREGNAVCEDREGRWRRIGKQEEERGTGGRRGI